MYGMVFHAITDIRHVISMLIGCPVIVIIAARRKRTVFIIICSLNRSSSISGLYMSFFSAVIVAMMNSMFIMMYISPKVISGTSACGLWATHAVKYGSSVIANMSTE